MEVSKLFSQELMAINLEVKSQEELFNVVSEELALKGFVQESYLSGIIEREAQFPTGLITQYINIGLPHGDAENVIKPFVYVVRLKASLQVRQMGDNQVINVNDFFFLGISEGSKQVGLLATLMELFMQESFVKAYKDAEEAEAIQTVIQKYIEIGVS